MHMFLPCPPAIAPIRVPRGRMAPSQPVGDPESLPPDPMPPQPHDPGDPVHVPRPRDPDMPAIDPNDPGIPTPRIGEPTTPMRCWFN